MRWRRLLAPLALALVAAAQPPPAARAFYLYDLSGATGPFRSTWAKLAYDRGHDELYVVHEGLVRIFNPMGMEIFSFGADEDVGLVLGLAVLPDGDLVVLASKEQKRVLLRCDYRGALVAPFEVKGLPPAFGAFTPETVEQVDGRLYVADTDAGKVVVTDLEGRVLATHSVVPLLKLDPKKKNDTSVGAFSVDGEGNMLFTFPMLFRAAILSPLDQLRSFGVKGSMPGKLNIAGKLVADADGTLYLTDRLRSVVMVWSKDLQFLGEFGYRGEAPGNLIAPYDLAVGNGKVYVSQAGQRGVSVFKVTVVQEPPPAAPARTAAPPASRR